jgi:hypothetical protein
MHTRAYAQARNEPHINIKADVSNLPTIFKTQANVWQFQLNGHIKKFGYTPTYFDKGRSMSSRFQIP